MKNSQRNLIEESQRNHQSFLSLSVFLFVFEIETVNTNCRQVFACNLAVVTLETGIMKSRLVAVPAKICLSIGYEPRILIAKIQKKSRTMRMQSAKWHCKVYSQIRVAIVFGAVFLSKSCINCVYCSRRSHQSTRQLPIASHFDKVM